MKRISPKISILLVLMLLNLAGCASNQHYNAAFSSQTALTQNQCSLTQPCDAIFKLVKQTFIQQGFTIEGTDVKTGIIKAVRNLQDKDDPEISYNIHASADISETATGESNVSLAASQQTILHRSTTTWWHLLWIIPIIPTGTEYQTLVIREGNITEPAFYVDFFNTLKVSVVKYETAVKAAAAKAAEKAEAERVAAEKAAKEKAQAEAEAAAEKAAKLRAETAAKAVAEAKAAAEKAEAERVAAEKAAKEKREAEAKAAAEKAETERLATEKMKADKEAADKAAAEATKLANEKATKKKGTVKR